MSYSPLDQFWLRVARGQISEYTSNHRFGTYDSVTTTFVPIARGGVYQTPTTAAALEVVSDDANDTSAGTGARTVTITGLDANWVEQTETVSMNGTTAVALSNTYIRVYYMVVATSGTYGNATAASHVGTITLQGTGAGVIWMQIYAGNFPRGVSECGVFTVPSGKTALIEYHYLSVESNKPATVIVFKRDNPDTVTAPYSAVTAEFELAGIQGFATLMDIAAPEGPFVGPCDIGFMARLATGTGSVSVAFEIILYTT